MSQVFINLTTLAVSFLTLFGSAELLYHQWKVKVEYSRKYVHLFTGILTLSFPLLLDSHWWVLLLCSAFGLILAASQRFSLLPSINAIERKSEGAILYPVAVYLCFLSYEWTDSYLFFYLPMLIMAISDPLAALSGKKWPRGPFKVGNETKTLTGSAFFMLSAWIISITLLLILSPAGWFMAIIMGGAIAWFTTLSEALSQRGFDNLAIPVVATGVLLYFSTVTVLY